MAATNAVDFYRNGAQVYGALEAVEKVIASQGIEPALHHLVLLRASQMNKCAFCVKMHTRDARKDGETSERLDRLIVWRHVGDFTAREKAAFAWTEALTDLKDEADMAAMIEGQRFFLRAQVFLRFGEFALQARQQRFAVLRRTRRADGATAQFFDFVGKRPGFA